VSVVTEVVKFGDICSLDRTHSKGAALPYVGLEDIVGGEGRFIGSAEPKKVQSSTFKFTSDHILYGRLRPYLNKVYLPDFDGHCSTEIFPIRPTSNADRRYLYYWLSMESTVKEIDRTSTGARMPRANVDAILEFPIPFPPLAEQQRIVAILDEAFAGLATATANAEKNLKNARELFESYLDLAIEGRLLPQDFDDLSVSELIEGMDRLRAAKIGQKKFENSKKALTSNETRLPFEVPKNWVVKRLEDLTSAIADGVHKTPKYVMHGIPFVTVKNLTAGPGISFDDLNYVTKADHQEFIKRTHPERGDILITKDGTIGVVRVIDTDVEFSIFVSVALIKPVIRDLTRYLAYAVSASCVQRQIVPKGAALKHLYLVDLRNLLIPLPPLTEQARIAKELDRRREQIDRLEATYREKLSALGHLKQSILQKAFSVELTAPPSQALKEAAE
jgi:type I restriction enzyme S subunit